MELAEIFLDNILYWLLVIAFLGSLTYAAFVIKNEKKEALDNSQPLKFQHLIFDIPPWWGTILHEHDKIIFERTDTRYDWRATFVWAPYEEVGEGDKDLKQVFIELIREKNIFFDEINSVIHSPESFQDHPLIKSRQMEIVRVEGTATEKEIERVYYDAVLMRDHQKKGYLFAESRSSVLNGLVEGPYFEQVILNFRAQEEMN